MGNIYNLSLNSIKFRYTFPKKSHGEKYMKKSVLILVSVLGGFIVTGCGNSDAVHAPLSKSPSFLQGQNDGCETAKGDYTKDGNLFRSDADYHDGWFYGRQQCNPSFHRK